MENFDYRSILIDSGSIMHCCFHHRHISVVPCLFINAGVEPLIHVNIGDVEGLAGLRHMASDALANGEPGGRKLLMCGEE